MKTFKLIGLIIVLLDMIPAGPTHGLVAGIITIVDGVILDRVWV
jgi:hypothetical protein